MKHTHLSHRKLRALLATGTATAFFCTGVGSALAASSWNPTLLVNTESFQVIDSGDGSSDIELRFGTTDLRLFWDTGSSKFILTKPLLVQGNLTATGSLSVKRAISGATLRIDGNSDLWGTLGVSGATVIKSTLTVNSNTKVRGALSGATLRVDGNADIWGTLSATGSIKTRGDLTINSDADTNDATLTFGNNTANQTLKFSNTNQRFEFSRGISVRGTLSGSTLRVDGNAAIWGNLSATGTIKTAGTVKAIGTLSGSSLTVDNDMTINNVTYSWQGTQGAANTFLKNDGNGALTWSTVSVGASSGNILSLHPEYPNAVYFQSGSTAVGTLGYSASGALDNYYRWTTTRDTLQDYWMSVRVQVPKNFSHFETASGIQLRVRTATTSAADNAVSFRLIDTTGAAVAVTNNTSIVSTTVNTWRTNTIGNVTAGTYAPLGYITLLVKLASTTSGFTDIGFLNLNWSNTTP